MARRNNRGNKPQKNYSQTPAGKFDAIMVAAANFPFAMKAGTSSTEVVKFGLIGVAIYKWLLSCGNVGELAGSDLANGANLGAYELYTAMRNHNSGATNYDAPDLMLFVLYYGQVMSILSYLKQCYRMCNTFKIMNTQIPSTLKKHAGIESWTGSLARVRSIINQAIVKLNSIYVPNNITIFDRWRTLFESTFVDADCDRGTIMWNMPKYLPQLSTDETKITFTAITDEFKLETLEATLNTLISSIYNSQAFHIMSGDLMRAYGIEKQFKLELVEDNAELSISYSDAVVQQYHNATIINPQAFVQSTLAIESAVTSQSNAYLKFRLEVSSTPVNKLSGAPVASCGIVDALTDKPTVEEVYRLTQWKCLCGPRKTSTYHDVIFGTEMCVGLTLEMFGEKTGTWNAVNIYSAYTEENVKTLCLDLLKATQFDALPNIYTYSLTENKDAIDMNGPITLVAGEITNPYVITRNDFVNITNIRIQSIFDIVD